MRAGRRLGGSGAPAPWGEGSAWRGPVNGWHGEVCLCSQVSSGGEFGRKFFVRPNSKSTCDTDKFQSGPAGASSRKVKESIRFPAQKLIRSRWNSGLQGIASLQAERGTSLLVGTPWPRRGIGSRGSRCLPGAGDAPHPRRGAGSSEVCPGRAVSHLLRPFGLRNGLSPGRHHSDPE